ncbi:membrane-associated protein, putative [Bodo saltans]|uniref:Membrane-associated protein, putative n=1 Tax=Bodo saltans TaxID=75058 RepID=A0A0S4J037_BODSA|nr:membrane-associated protein, putative [Bodo saltans]|eukprot:CUG14104.1 membrane-associated protein, putative [Bodo saltans]
MAQIQQDRVRCRLLHTLLVASLLVVNTVYAVVDSAEGSDVASVATATEDAAMVLGSQCSITTGCPRSSMAWASGSFTEDGVLTPQALALDTQLTLQISLCCGYLFHGGMLENSANGEEMYDVFLETLLHATPLRIFSADEKRKLFPRSAAVIGNTANGKKYSTVVRADDDEVAFGNDGDGDVLILTTGAIDAAAFRIPFKSIATKPTGTSSRKSDTNNNIAEVGENDETDEEAYDMQLLLSNRVLKCKCPHTLHVMPMLYLKRDRVPALRLRGGGARCVTSADILVVSSDDLVDTDAPAPSPTVQHSFTSVAKIPPFSYVVWEVYNTHPSWNGPRNGAGHHHQRHSKGVVADPLSTVLPVLVHRRWTTVGLPKNSASRHEDHPHDLQGTTLSEDGMNFTFPAHLHTRYRVSLRVVKGSATGETSDRLVLRAKVLEFWTTVSYPLQPFVGYRYAAVVRTAVSLVNDDTAVNRPEDVQLLRDIVFSPVGRDDGDYHTRWIVTNSNDAAAAPAIPLFGANTTKVPVQLVSFIVVDSDEACPPVTVEQHNVFAIQLLITSPTPSPFTACTNETRLEARDERPLLTSDLRRQLLASQRPLVTSSNANYSQLWFHNVEVDAEQWHCSFIPQRSALELTTADALRDTNKIASPCIMAPSSATRIASLDTRDPVVTAVQWRLRLRFSRRTASPAEQSTALVHALEEQLIETAWYGGVVESSSLTLLLDAYSPPLLIYRRTAALPVEVDVYLPMHALSYNVSAPNVIVRGRWAARSPLSLRTSPNAAVVTLGTALVPNIQQTLPRGTLQFIVADPGEMVSISRALLGWLLEHRRTPRQVAVPLTTEPIPVLGDVHDARSAAVSTTADSTSVSFIARCPDAAVEYRIHVVAFPPEAVVPAHELIVTEDAVLTLRAPRPPAKGEEISWTVENCTSDAVPTEMVVVLTSADTGALLSGIHPHMHCDVRWTALNVAGAAYKVFSIRRCEKPPALKFFTTAGTTGRAQITPVLRRRNAASLQFDETELTLSTFDDPSLVLVLPFAGMNMTTVVSFEAESARSRFSTEWTAMNSWVLSGFLHKQYATSSSSAMHQSLWDSMSWVPQSSLVISSASPQQESSSADNEAGSFSGIETLLNFNATQRGLLTHIQFIEAVAPQWMAEPYATDAQVLFPPYGMCPPRLGHIFTLHVTPLDLVPPTSVDKETNLPVLEMCAETMLLARHPSLHDVYGYSWEWSCAKSFDELLGAAGATESQDSSSPILVEPIPDRHLFFFYP